MVPLTWQMVVDAAAESIGASKAEVMAAIKQPLHPAGMRDEFATAALTGLMSGNYKWSDVSFSPVCGKTDGQNTALCAYHVADAMLEARNANR